MRAVRDLETERAAVVAAVAAVVVAAAVGLTAAGCGDSLVPATDAAVDAACQPAACVPYGCDDRRGGCFHHCNDVVACAPGYACEGGLCVGTECTEQTAAEACGVYACINGVCALDCAVGPCAEGYYCRADTARCWPRCTRAGDPGCEGYLCEVEVGECQPYCFAGELACAAGYLCDSEQRCVADPTAPSCQAGCGDYACLEALDRCATRCVDDEDCAVGRTCTGGACGLAGRRGAGRIAG